MSKKLYFIAAAVLIAFYFLQTYKPMLSEAEVAANKAASEAFMQSNASQTGVQTTASGLQYLRLEAGTGTEHPTPTDSVTVHYVGQLMDGTEFDSSVKRGKPITFGLNKVIPGWKEGLRLMVVGDKFRLFIPPELAYGEQWAGDIPPNSALIFDVELLAIQ